MKKIMFICLFALTALTASAQKFALLDMEYILKNIPAYERANEQLNQVSKKWQAEVEALSLEAQTLYKNYQNEVVFLSQEQVLPTERYPYDLTVWYILLAEYCLADTTRQGFQEIFSNISQIFYLTIYCFTINKNQITSWLLKGYT